MNSTPGNPHCLRVDVEHNSLLQCIKSPSLSPAHKGRIYLFIYLYIYIGSTRNALHYLPDYACLSLYIRLPLPYRTHDGAYAVFLLLEEINPAVMYYGTNLSVRYYQFLRKGES